MLSTSQLLERAAEETGLDDFGTSTFRAGLDRLVDGLTTEARLTPLGSAMAENQLMTILRNRLQVQDWWTRHPELEKEQVERPLVIVGMSRSGTTALSHLLGKDPGLRSLRKWEAAKSVPPPEAASYWTDPRYLEAIDADAASDAVLPGLKALHHDPADAPVECNSLFAHEFNSTVFPTVFFLPTFFRWMMATDLSPMYAYHERMLALLQSRAPGRWNLKGPQHGYAMPYLRRQYPDATVIVTHRDPAMCVASTASLISFLNARTSDAFDPAQVGEVTADFLGRCADGLVADAGLRGHDGMVHVHYQDLIDDPIQVIRTIYARADRELTPTVEAAMRAHVDERPQHQYGVHRYTAADFGLARTALDERFAEYNNAFHVRREKAVQ